MTTPKNKIEPKTVVEVTNKPHKLYPLPFLLFPLVGGNLVGWNGIAPPDGARLTIVRKYKIEKVHCVDVMWNGTMYASYYCYIRYKTTPV